MSNFLISPDRGTRVQKQSEDRKKQPVQNELILTSRILPDSPAHRLVGASPSPRFPRFAPQPSLSLIPDDNREPKPTKKRNFRNASRKKANAFRRGALRSQKRMRVPHAKAANGALARRRLTCRRRCVRRGGRTTWPSSGWHPQPLQDSPPRSARPSCCPLHTGPRSDSSPRQGHGALDRSLCRR